MMRTRARPGSPPTGASRLVASYLCGLCSRRRKSSISSSLVVVIFVSSLLIVPIIKPSQCQLQQAFNPTINPRFQAANIIQPFNRQHQQANNVIINRRNDLQQELSQNELQQIFQEQQAIGEQQQQQPKAARQLFITDFVSNQGHKLLKNFVNNTLVDLVASRHPAQTYGNVGLSRFINTNQHQLAGDHRNAFQLIGKPVEQQQQRPYLPTIGKLYSFLFPQQQQQQLQQQEYPKVGEELIEPSSSDSIDFYDAASNFGTRPKRTSPSSPVRKFISLHAPYESNQVKSSLIEANTLPTFDLASNESKWRRDKSNETMVAYPDDQQPQGSVDSSLVDSGSEEDPKSMSMFQGDDSQPELVQSVSQADEEDQINSDSDSGEFKFADDPQNLSGLMEYEPQHNRSIFPISQQQNESTTSEASSNAESFFNHLPSSYDSPVRVPPEGYYDDYYKLASSQTAGFQTPAMDSLIPENQPDNHQLDESFLHLANDSATSNHEPANNSSGVELNQYYMSQKPIRQSDHSASDQRVEFMTTSNGTEYPPPPASIRQYNHQPAGSKENATTTTRQQQHSSSEQDNIQLILANTNSSFDPINNEKIINYISEGQNVTFQPASGKSPRHTFVNKDMNEPPPEPHNHQNNQSSASRGHDKSSMQVSGSLVTQTTTPSSSYMHHQRSNHHQLVGTSTSSPTGEFYLPSKSFDQARRPTTSNMQIEHDDNEPSYAPRNDYDDSAAEDEAGDEAEALRRLNMETGQSYGQYNRVNKPRSTGEKAKRVNSDTQPGKRRENHSRESPNRRRRQQQNMRHQPTVRRPQVTEAHFNPKDLVLSVPTPQPSVTESALESITDLPTKVKKLRDNQPDKNELMNELLTALDRVKVAIYKLQPLTAKMNAIYRKSVTSNTRDTVLDSNKGTYAKRYPPGDYDDSYDRMHPSELLVARTNPAARSRRGRQQRASPSRHPRRMLLAEDESTEESATSATYLPAPREMLLGASTNTNVSQQETSPFVSRIRMESELDGEQTDEIVATGIGRRMGDGKFEGEVVSFGSTGDDEDLRLKLADQFAAADNSSSSSSPTGADLDANPTFGYRITIYRSPEDGNGSDEDEQVEQVSGELETPSASERLSYSIGAGDDQELLLTSESSLVESSSEPSLSSNKTTIGGPIGDEGEELSGAESKEKEKKKKSEKWQKRKEKKEKEGKQDEKAHKHQERKKKDEEESKKKKEYKKIKHNKGLISKESKKMHRDKHVKAHDRGAAKEKALKERTQIEFFEREQIVDDEFEKGKKSMMKAGWQSGHEAKKSTKDIAGGDSMSMGGSHYVAHEQPASFSEKGHGSASESSSGKKSNKFEKKDMESKGKKFKGWREKGYKIITETEFVDRGSLHDSAYKKRDKGAAHHKKYKKQEASSEGHHGSMQEHHKKSHKKEEKKEKKEEKHMKKGESEEKKKEKGEKEKKKKKMMEKGKKKEEADEEESMLAATISPSDEMIELMNRNQRSRQPISMDSRAWRFTPNNNLMDNQRNSPTLSRLLNVEHDSKPALDFNEPTKEYHHHSSPVLPQRPNNTMSEHYQQRQQSVGRESMIQAPEVDNSTNQDESNIRRSDNVAGSTAISHQQTRPNNASALLDIVDNLTGQRINKTRVGTYEVDDQSMKQPQQQRYPISSPIQKFLAPDSRASRLLSISPISQQPTAAATSTTTSTTTTTTTTTQRPRQAETLSTMGDKRGDLQKLVNLLRAEQLARHKSENSPDRPYRLPMIDNQQMTTISRANSNYQPSPQAIASRVPSNNVGIAAAQAFLNQLAQKASVGSPSDVFDLPGSSFGPQFNDPLQASFLAQTQQLPMSATNNYQQTAYFPHPPAGHQTFEFGPTSPQASSILFPNDQLLADYESADTILAPNMQSTFATD